MLTWRHLKEVMRRELHRPRGPFAAADLAWIHKQQREKKAVSETGIRIVIEGPLGSGKSVLAALISETLKVAKYDVGAVLVELEDGSTKPDRAVARYLAKDGESDSLLARFIRDGSIGRPVEITTRLTED